MNELIKVGKKYLRKDGLVTDKIVHLGYLYGDCHLHDPKHNIYYDDKGNPLSPRTDCLLTEIFDPKVEKIETKTDNVFRIVPTPIVSYYFVSYFEKGVIKNEVIELIDEHPFEVFLKSDTKMLISFTPILEFQYKLFVYLSNELQKNTQK